MAWKPTPTQAKHIEVNRILMAAGWGSANSRKGVAVYLFDGGEMITYRFGEGQRSIMLRDRSAPTPEEAWHILHD